MGLEHVCSFCGTRACLSIIIAPVVESSFSIMINAIHQSAKYDVRGSKKTSHQLYHRPDVLHLPVDTSVFVCFSYIQ